MRKILAYSKAIAALVGAIVTDLLATLPPDQFKWLAVIGVIATAITTFAVPNIPDTASAAPKA